MNLISTPGRYCLLYWDDEKCYSEVLESKLVEPKEATVGAIAKLKQGGKFYSGTITAVGTKAEIEQRWKELESADEESHSPTTRDQDLYVYIITVYMYNVRCMYMYMCVHAYVHVHVLST